MTNQELINKLAALNPTGLVQFYFLSDNDLKGCEIETIIEADNQTELTIKLNGSDEGGYLLNGEYGVAYD